MIPTWLLIMGSLLAAAVTVPLCRRIKPWLSFLILAASGALLSVLIIGVAVAAERFANYSTFTARYLEYSRELRSMIDQGQADRVPAAILFFDAKVQGAPQSADVLAEAVQAIKSREFAQTEAEQKRSEPPEPTKAR